jgi:hypothetical protein
LPATATDGEITVTATGGTGTITYLKTTEPASASNVFSNLAAGTYHQIRDVPIVFPQSRRYYYSACHVAISSAVKLHTMALNCCATATDGVITVTATGGTGTITYLKTTEQFPSF